MLKSTGINVLLPISLLFGCQSDNELNINKPESSDGQEQNDSIEPESTEDPIFDAAELLENIRMVDLEPGSFMMGIPGGDEDWDAGHEPHMVELTHEFSISKTEVTIGQFMAYMDYNPPLVQGGELDPTATCMNCPVHSVSWHEIAAYSNAVSEEHGLDSCFTCEGEGVDVQCEPRVNAYECNGFRLPTEAEWEYAAIGGEDHIYPGSEDINDIGWWVDNSNMTLYHVAQKKPNGYGLYDMGGNIREYVYDWYDVYSGEDRVNPVVEPKDGSWPAERGGSYACRRPELRVDRRNLVSGYDRDAHSGFRLVRIID